MRILFLSRWLPYPPDNGSKLRILGLLTELAREHEISLVSFAGPTERLDDDGRRALAACCASVEVVTYPGYRAGSARAVAALLSPRPRSLVDARSPALLAAAAAAARGCDLIVASQLDMVPYALALPGPPALFEELELSQYLDPARRAAGLPARVRPMLTALKLGAYLRRALPRFAACTVVSERERQNLRQLVPGYSRVSVIPNALDLSRYQGSFGQPEPNSLVFPGALTYDANRDAAEYFLGSVLPLVATAEPAVALRITGSTAGVDLSTLPRHPAARYTGYVPDIRPVVAQSWASVVPLRLGGGTRLKILESMALGTPVVATSKGAEGLEATDGQNILIADDPAAFADKLVALLRSPELRERLAAGGRRLVEARYDWRAVGRDLRALVGATAPARVA
ncbi:MAG TPA: glycosyltransferase family 4 protein [Chloroflexota bacterium]